MNPRKPLALGLIALVAIVLSGCGAPGSSSGNPSPTASAMAGASATADASATAGGSTAATCPPVAGDQLVVLEDDKHLQTVDNIIPAANAAAVAKVPEVIDLLNTVSAALTTDKLIALNKAVDVDRRTSAQAATQFIQDENLTASPLPRPTPFDGSPVIVGATNFSESDTLAQIYAQVLRSAGYSTNVQTLDARETYLPALEKGQITVFPEYVGTLTEYLNKQVNGPNAAAKASGDLDATVAALRELGTQQGLVFGQPAAAQDQNAFAVTKAFADQHGVTTLSGLAAACAGIVLGGGPECVDRPFCEAGLEKTYGMSIGRFVALDSGGPLTKSALQQGEIALGVVFSSDGQLG